jgi:hypothetical protein
MALVISGNWAQIMAPLLEAQILAVLRGLPQDMDILVSQHVSRLDCGAVALADLIPNRFESPMSR